MTDPRRRPTLRSVAMPAEHGGWGLTLEPGSLGLLLAPSLAALMLGVAALAVFLVRTPLRLVLVGRHHAADRTPSAFGLERRRLATRVAALELIVLLVAVVVTALVAIEPMWWVPGLVAAPLFAVALWFDLRSLSRHLVPEIVGSIAVASVAAMGALAGGAAWSLAIGAWLILAARILTSIPYVRAQVRRIHGREAPSLPTLMGDVAAVGVTVAAFLLDASLILGALAMVGLIAVQRVALGQPPQPAKALGIRQMVLGFAVVGATAIGAWLPQPTV
jgi:hypothetical protein